MLVICRPAADAQPITVAKLQVGLLSVASELREDLERIADKADTSGREGLHYLLQVSTEH